MLLALEQLTFGTEKKPAQPITMKMQVRAALAILPVLLAQDQQVQNVCLARLLRLEPMIQAPALANAMSIT